MISVCGADVPAWTDPAAIFVEKLNSVQRVCSNEMCIAYEAAWSVWSMGANNKPPKMRPDTNSSVQTESAHSPTVAADTAASVSQITLDPSRPIAPPNLTRSFLFDWR